MKKMMTGFIAGALLAAGASAQTYTYYTGSTASAGLGNAENWSDGLPTGAGVVGMITNNVSMPLGGTSFAGWTAVQTAGTISRGGVITFDQGVHWTLQGGTVTSGQHVAIGSTTTAGTMVMNGGALVANTNFLVRSGSSFSQSGGTLTFAGAAEIGANGGGTANISGGTGSFGSISVTGGLIAFSGGSWTTTGNLHFGGSTTGAGIRFDLGDGSLTVDTVSFNAGYIDFVTGSDGTLTVSSFTDASNFEALWNTGRIRRDGANTGTFADNFTVTGDTLSVIPEPAALTMFLVSGLALIVYRRMR
ncbi:MAG: hypothetical protein WC959_02015 [Kiritimatiellales bacterium]